MKTIGIGGGVGPYAGLDLAKKIFDNTEAQHDQEHLDVLLVNNPRLIDDWTAYILAVRDGKVATDPATDPANPGRGIVACIRKLAAAGAEVVGVPCNTAHAPLITSEEPRRSSWDARKFLWHLSAVRSPSRSSTRPSPSRAPSSVKLDRRACAPVSPLRRCRRTHDVYYPVYLLPGVWCKSGGEKGELRLVL